MIKRFSSYLSPRVAAKPAPATLPAGQRVYAIGDIHGRLDLFEELIGQIERDDARRGTACETTVILLGDLVDRGPDSAGVIQTARAWARVRPVRLLAGNHEEMFLKSFTSLEVLRHFLRFGGKDTLLSYPLDRATYQDLTLEALQERLPQIVPPRTPKTRSASATTCSFMPASARASRSTSRRPPTCAGSVRASSITPAITAQSWSTATPSPTPWKSCPTVSGSIPGRSCRGG